RLGGEEFAVVLPNTLTQDAFTLAEQIRKSIEQAKIRRSAKHEDVGGITVSIGIADCEITGNWQDALSRADTALYVSKKMGRNKTTVYDSSMEKIDHN
ncbi:MAG: GGDEF domain-containing protein, partial [Gallionellales bacterium CG17_big_fil_post_rev_8_21_14_2_50_54_146]